MNACPFSRCFFLVFIFLNPAKDFRKNGQGNALTSITSRRDSLHPGRSLLVSAISIKLDSSLEKV